MTEDPGRVIELLRRWGAGDRAAKRGKGASLVTWNEAIGAGGTDDVEILALEEALSRLGEMDERLGQVVVLRFFGGLTVDEIANVLGVSAPTVKRDWSTAKAWLYRELPEDERAAFLTEQCGDDEELRREVRSLLAAGENAGSFLGSVADTVDSNEAPPGSASDSMPAAIGRYRILRKLGSGGMGVVYEAETLARL